MREKSSGEEYDASLEEDSSDFVAPENRPKPKKRPGSKVLNRLSLARLYSIATKRTRPSSPEVPEDVRHEARMSEDTLSPVSKSSVQVPGNHSSVEPSSPMLSNLASDEARVRDDKVHERQVDPQEERDVESETKEKPKHDKQRVSEDKPRVDKLDAILSRIAARKKDTGKTIWADEEDSDKIPPMVLKKEKLRTGEPISKMKTYVEGFDDALDGGIPEGNIILISGASGAMKSTLAYYIIYTNILARGAACLYVTLEQTMRSLLSQMSSLGMNPEAVTRDLRMFDMGFIRKHLGKSKKNWFKIFMKNVDRLRSQRSFDLIVIDSLEALEVLASFENRRVDLYQLFEWLRDMETTAFIITERSECPFGTHLSHLRNEEEFLADGIINLALHPINDIDVQRRIRCIKMRGTKHETSYLSLMWDDGKFKVAKTVGR